MGKYTPPAMMSPSSVSTFVQCPMKFKFNKLEKIYDPSTEAQHRGSYVHEVLEDLLALPNAERTIKAAKSIARDLWTKEWEKQFNELEKTTGDANAFKWQVLWCLEDYFSLENPQEINPAGLETKVSGEIGGVPIRGIVDRWSLTEDDKLIVTDYKSGKAPQPRYTADKKFQITTYAVLLEDMTGKEASYGELLYLTGGKRATYTPTPALRAKTEKTLVDTWDELKVSCDTGEFECRTGPLCGWCSYKPMCPAFN